MSKWSKLKRYQRRWQRSTWKDAPEHRSPMNYKWKRHEIPSHIHTNGKMKTLTTWNVDEDARPEELSLTARKKLKSPDPIQHNDKPWDLPKGVGHLFPHKLYTYNIYSSSTTKISFGRWMDKWTVRYPNNGTSFNAKKTWQSLKYILISERSQFEKAQTMILNRGCFRKGKTVETWK